MCVYGCANNARDYLPGALCRVVAMRKRRDNSTSKVRHRTFEVAGSLTVVSLGDPHYPANAMALQSQADSPVAAEHYLFTASGSKDAPTQLPADAFEHLLPAARHRVQRHRPKAAGRALGRDGGMAIGDPDHRHVLIALLIAQRVIMVRLAERATPCVMCL